jgi:hypothetical protein
MSASEIVAAESNRAAAPVGLDLTDPANADFAILLDRSVPVIRVLDLYDDVDAYIIAVQTQLQSAISRRQTLGAIADAKMRDDDAEKVVHRNAAGDEIVAEMKTAPPVVEKRIDVLRALRDLKNADGEQLIPADDLDKAIRPVQPDPTWYTHLTHLRKLSKYGKAAKEILDKGLVESEPLPRLVITRVTAPPKNVTPIAEGAR